MMTMIGFVVLALLLAPWVIGGYIWYCLWVERWWVRQRASGGPG